MFNPREDLIDFPTSPLWAEHFADQGMTPGFPDEYYYKPAPEYHIPSWVKPDWVKEQQGKMQSLQGQVTFLQRKLNEHLDWKSKGKPKGKY